MDTLTNRDARKILRIKNIQNILDILLQRGEVARVELSKITGLTKTAITSLTKDLIDKGIIEEKPPVLNKTGIGRNVIPLKIRKDAAYIIGIGLERHHLKGVLIDAHGKILYKKDGPIYKDIPPQEIINILFRVIDNIIENNSDKRVNAIGIGMPGPLDPLKGIVMNPPKFYGWRNIPLADIVTNHYHIPTWIENDANCAAFAERWYGEGKGLNTFIYILLNEGVGSGVIINGNIYKSPINFEGEIGHAVIRYKDRIDFLENFSGFERIDDPVLFIKSGKIEQIGILIGEAIATISNFLGPEKVFIGGKMAVLGENILNPIAEEFNKYFIGKMIDIEIPIKISKIYKDAISVGAAAYAMRKYVIRKIVGDLK